MPFSYLTPKPKKSIEHRIWHAVWSSLNIALEKLI